MKRKQPSADRTDRAGQTGQPERVERAEKVRYAVVGLGNIAQVAVLPAFQHASENSELVALISSDPEKLRVLSEEYDVPFTGSYDEMARVLIEARVDAAYVALPNSAHRHATESLAALGIHVLCEKPMAMTSEDCEAMIRVTREHDVKLMVAYRLHFEKANLDVVERIKRGEIGDPLFFSSTFAHQVCEGNIRTKSETGGGALFDMGIYCVNAARYIFQAEPEEVFGRQLMAADRRLGDVDATTIAVLRFPGERLAMLTASQAAADIGEYRVVGTKGHIRLDPAYEYQAERKQFVTIGDKTEESSFPQNDQFAPELVYFSRCILDNVEPEPSGEEGLADVRIMEAIVRSSLAHHSVELPPYLRRRRPSSQLEMAKRPVGKVKVVHAPSPSR